jgi:hypothetical protein
MALEIKLMNQDNIKQQIKPGGGTSVLGGALRA